MIWGLWHGMFMIIERVIRNENWYKKIPSFIKIFITLFIVIIGWVLFKATTLEEGLKYLSIMFGLSNFSNITFEYTYFISRKFIVLIIIGIMASTPIFKKIFNRYRGIKVFELIKTLLIILLFIISIIFMVNSTYSPFIYFQF